MFTIRNSQPASLTIFICFIWTLSAWGDSLIYTDDFSVQMPEWTLSVDGGYVGQPTSQGNLTQSMIDGALAGSYANVAGGTLNLKANTTIGRDWGAASAILNVKLPANFRMTFSSVKTQWAGHQRFKFIESDPTVPLLANTVAPVDPKHGRAIAFSVAGFVSYGLNYEPTEDMPQGLDVPRDNVHNVGHIYHYEIEKIADRIEVLRDGALQFDYSGGLALDFLNYLGIVNLQAGATSMVDDLQIYSIPDPAPRFYWTDPGGSAVGSDVIRRANADGSGIQTVASGLEEPRGMALDLVNKRMYWTDLGNGAIRTSNLDGSGPIQSVVAIGGGGGGVALDIPNGKMYWTDGDNIPTPNGRIRRANLDGSEQETLVPGRAHPVGIDIDPVHGKIYWTELQTSFNGHGSIWSANLDGSNVETILTGIDGANGLALDPIHGKLYWPDGPTHRIQSANLDGTGLHDVVTGLDSPTTVDLDLSHGKIYWTSSGGQQANQILRANLDGSDIETLVSGVGFPWGIAVVPELAECKTLLDFNFPAPGTLKDANGVGTGFTHRLPGTGSALPENDPNMDLATVPGKLRLTSTHADINQGPGPTGNNLSILEAPGVYVPGIGSKDVVVKAVFEDVNVPNGSDQLTLYAGVNENKVIRAGIHELNVFIMSPNNGAGDMNTFTGPGAFSTGDDIEVTLSRRSGLWSCLGTISRRQAAALCREYRSHGLTPNLIFILGYSPPMRGPYLGRATFSHLRLRLTISQSHVCPSRRPQCL